MRPGALALTAVFTALVAVCAQLSLDLPLIPVPFTLQVLAVLLAGALLGPRLGPASLVLYLLLGAVGLPVFARFSGGFRVLVGPTAGYLWAFPVAAWVVGRLAPPEARPGWPRLFGAMVLGVVIIHLGGAGWARLVTGKAAGEVLAGWVLPFLLPDLGKAALAAAVARGAGAALLRMGRGSGRAAA